MKKSRLIASENRELLKTIEQKDEEIATLKQEHAREMAKQEELLEKCRDERDALNKRLKGQIEQQVSGVLEAVMNDNKALRDQVAQLQAKVEELQAKVNSN